ncbi:MAG: protoporphyrinogen oxidase [Gemmatimonadota bacterium]
MRDGPIQRRVAVVGAGISGLLVAHGLQGAGVPCTLFEASDRVGGVIRSGRVDGRVAEWGPQRLRLTADLRALVEELDIVDELLLAPGDLPLYIVRDGRMHEVPRSLSALVRGDLLSPLGRLRVLFEPLTAPVDPEETVAGALRRKFGDEAYRVLLGPLIGGLYASDPANMRARDSLHGFIERLGAPRSLLLRALAVASGRRVPPACSFREGLGTLPNALARALGPTLRRRHTVSQLSADGTGRWRLSFSGPVATDGARGREGPFSAVVLAVPAGRAAGLLEHAAPGAARRLGRLRYNRLALVHLACADRLPAGFGYQVALGEPLETRGVTFNESLFGREGLATAFLGGAANPRLPGWPDERVAAVAETEFERVIGRGATSIEISRPEIPAYDLSWEALDDLRMPEGVHLCAGYIGRAGVVGRMARARRLVRKLVEES